MGTQSQTTKATRRAGRDQAALLVLAPDAVLTLTEAALLATVSLRHLMAERSLGRGPKCYSLGRKAIRTTKADVLAWATSRPEKTQ